MKRTLLSWSSGKDSAWSLHLLRQQKEYEIVGLLTTFNQTANRVAMHAVRRSLVEAQAKAAGIPLWAVDLPWPCTNADYERIMKETCKAAVRGGNRMHCLWRSFLGRYSGIPREAIGEFRIGANFSGVGHSHAGACTFHDQVWRACEAHLR